MATMPNRNRKTVGELMAELRADPANECGDEALQSESAMRALPRPKRCFSRIFESLASRETRFGSCTSSVRILRDPCSPRPLGTPLRTQDSRGHSLERWPVPEASWAWNRLQTLLYRERDGAEDVKFVNLSA